MTNDMNFDAPWGKSLKIMTGIAMIILLGTTLWGFGIDSEGSLAQISMVVLPIAIIVGTMFFMVRGYQIKGDQLIIQRLGWATTIALTHLNSAEHEPEAMKGSMRTFGIGGLFSFVGFFTNGKLNSYRAYATDPKKSVVLRFPDRTIVVTPDSPEKFVDRCKKNINSTDCTLQ